MLLFWVWVNGHKVRSLSTQVARQLRQSHTTMNLISPSFWGIQCIAFPVHPRVILPVASIIQQQHAQVHTVYTQVISKFKSVQSLVSLLFLVPLLSLPREAQSWQSQWAVCAAPPCSSPPSLHTDPASAVLFCLPVSLLTVPQTSSSLSLLLWAGGGSEGRTSSSDITPFTNRGAVLRTRTPLVCVVSGVDSSILGH